MLSIEVGVWGGVCEKKKENKPHRVRGIVLGDNSRLQRNRHRKKNATTGLPGGVGEH